MKKDSSAHDLMDEIDFPHRRDGGIWRSTRPALASPGEVFDCYNQTVRAIKVMQKHGISDKSIVKIVHDLYWAAVTEKHLDDLARLQAKAEKFLGELHSLRHPEPTERKIASEVLAEDPDEDTFGKVRVHLPPETFTPPCATEIPGPEAARQ